VHPKLDSTADKAAAPTPSALSSSFVIIRHLGEELKMSRYRIQIQGKVRFRPHLVPGHRFCR